MNPGVLGTSGSAETQRRLLHYIRSGRIHPGLLLIGPDRNLKIQIARRLAMALLCKNATPDRPFCGTCSACRRIEKDGHPDVLFFHEPEEDNIKIDSVRHLCHQMELGPTEGPIKIAIIDEVHRMNASAANAFLKTLEEPGTGRYFWLLTTQPGSLLATTRSRCIEFIFKPDEPQGLPAEEFAEYRTLFEKALTSKSPQPVIALVDKDKDRCLGFLKYLQTELHAVALSDSPEARRRSVGSPVARLATTDLVRKFDEAVQLEGRLRSNANHGLMLEVFLRREFFA